MTNFRNRDYEWRWASRRSEPEDPEDERFDPQQELEDDVAASLARICQQLEDRLTDDMALRAFRCRNGRKPRDGDEFELFKKELIAEAYNAGYEDWDAEFLEFD